MDCATICVKSKADLGFWKVSKRIYLTGWIVWMGGSNASSNG